MPRGGARPGAGRKAKDQPDQPLLTYSLTVRLTDVGILNQLGRGNLSLGLRRLVDQHRARTRTPATAPSLPTGPDSPLPGAQVPDDTKPIRSDKKETTYLFNNAGWSRVGVDGGGLAGGR